MRASLESSVRIPGLQIRERRGREEGSGGAIARRIGRRDAGWRGRGVWGVFFGDGVRGFGRFGGWRRGN